MNGKVWLVGAGPGDPGLLTLRAAQLMASADVVIYDFLVEPSILEMAGPCAECIYMGKSGSHKGAAQRQSAIQQALVDHARAGRNVVRLKGGDPFVFGRGGEEAQALVAAGIEFEVVPGISSSIAVPAYAGIPVTHRDHNTALAIVTGHEDPNQPDGRTNWRALAGFAASGGTLVILMGVKNLERNMRFLIAEGVAKEVPSALVRWGTRPDQRVVLGTVATMSELAEKHQLAPPAVCVVGPVAALGNELSWFRPGPLNGARVLVTRPMEVSGPLCEALRDAGGRPARLPLIEIDTSSRPDELSDWVRICRQRIGQQAAVVEGSWLAFTSANGVRSLHKALNDGGLDARALSGYRVAAVGSATAQALRSMGVCADLVAASGAGSAGARLGVALVQRGALAVTAFVADSPRPELGDVLRDNGVASYEQIGCYRTRASVVTSQQLALVRDGVCAVVLSSPSTARAYADLFPDSKWPLIAIGPTTAAAMRTLGLEVAGVARTPSVSDQVEAVLEVLGEC